MPKKSIQEEKLPTGLSEDITMHSECRKIGGSLWFHFCLSLQFLKVNILISCKTVTRQNIWLKLNNISGC